MSRNGSILRSLDWWTIAMFICLALFGWVNIYGASYNFDQTSIFSFSNRAGKQFVWFLTALVMGTIILIIDYKTYDILAYIFYGAWLALLVLTPILAHDVKGSLSWLQFGPISLQPAEFAKCFTALALAKYMSRYDYQVRTFRDLIVPLLIMGAPMLIIMIWQKETGSALVFAAFLLMFYREGMTGYILLVGAAAIILFIMVIRLGVIPLPIGSGSYGITLSLILIMAVVILFVWFKHHRWKESLIMAGIVVLCYAIGLVLCIWFNVNFNIVSVIALLLISMFIIWLALRYQRQGFGWLAVFAIGACLFCYSCNFAFEKILQPHQRIRIEVLLGLKDDPSGAGYNVNQAKIAIGSGEFKGKGFRQGTQTKLQFVPEQATDFIFCTVGEEWGFVGSSLVLILYMIFILRLISLAERQKDKFSQIYGYCVASIFTLHLAINVGMVLGLLPVIGIPLPFFSYGGSSLWGFTLLLFIFLKLDASRVEKMR